MASHLGARGFDGITSGSRCNFDCFHGCSKALHSLDGDLVCGTSSWSIVNWSPNRETACHGKGLKPG